MEAREIKFRGKSNGQWVYGSLCTKYENEPESIYIIDDDCCYHKVDKESVGQFIGIADKHQREIYENDTCIWSSKDGETKGIIIWEQQACAFWLKWFDGAAHRYKELRVTYGDGELYMNANIEVLVDGTSDLFTVSGQEKMNT